MVRGTGLEPVFDMKLGFKKCDKYGVFWQCGFMPKSTFYGIFSLRLASSVASKTSADSNALSSRATVRWRLPATS